MITLIRVLVALCVSPKARLILWCHFFPKKPYSDKFLVLLLIAFMVSLIILVPRLSHRLPASTTAEPPAIEDNGWVTTNYDVTCTNCSPSAPSTLNVPNGYWVNETISVTAVFQTLIAKNGNKKVCMFQNQGAHMMYVSLSSEPTLANSVLLPPGAIYYCASSNNISILDQLSIAGTSGDVLTGEWHYLPNKMSAAYSVQNYLDFDVFEIISSR